jgi:hypothetical protein
MKKNLRFIPAILFFIIFSFSGCFDGGGSSGDKDDSYSVIYNSNGATSGDVPDDNNSYKKGDAVTVLGNTGDLSKSGWSFAGWTDGSSTFLSW